MKLIDSNIFQTRIIIGNIINDFDDYIPNNNIFIIADANVAKYYPKIMLNYPHIIIHTSEKNKNLNTLEYIYNKLMENNIDRSFFILGIGGGITSDLVGLAATTFMRGIKFGFIPTTLIGMSDAAIGGKNSINFGGYKNIIGTVNQPKIILIDPNFLNTLSQKDVYAGFAEIIKTSLIWDRETYHYLHNNYNKLLDLNLEELTYLIHKIAIFKLSIVEKDQYDEGLRKLLNFGHTFGHAIEAEFHESHFITHGEAITIGMIIAMKISVKLNLLDKAILENVIEIFENFNLPTKISFDCKNILNKILKDKKKEQEHIKMILLEDIAKPVIKKFNIYELGEYCNDLYNI